MDLESAISNQQRATSLTDDSHPNRPTYLSNLGDCQQTRFRRLGNLSDLEGAILNQQKAVELTDDKHTDKPTYLNNLGIFQRSRFECLGSLVESIGRPDNPGQRPEARDL